MVAAANAKIAAWLEEHREQIERGYIQVWAVDECHLHGDDICGYGWGNRTERRTVEVVNYKDSQTYYGAINCMTGELYVQSYPTANSEKTIEFVGKLMGKQEGAKMLLLWDGASYHRSEAFKDFLTEVNGQDEQEDWMIHCLRFAPYSPAENPIENIWGQIKRVVAQMYEKCRSFAIAKRIFEFIIAQGWYSLPDLSKYGAFANFC
jgi:transposase